MTSERFKIMELILLICALSVSRCHNEQNVDLHACFIESTKVMKQNESTYPAELRGSLIHVIDTDSLTVYYPNFSRIDLVTGTMPDKLTDTSVVFCCEAAYTGECLTEFKHTNIAGDHVSSGERFRGYRCTRNTEAFVWYENQWKFLWKEYSHELDSAAKHNGMGFGQEMMIHQGKLCETIRKDGNVNQFRALCEVDGRLCVIDCKMQMAFGMFKKQLIAYGVKEALYLDMGPGWNHSWYRDEDGNAVDIFPYQHPYCTNWVVFYR